MMEDIEHRQNEFDGRPDLIKKRARSIIVTRLLVIGVLLFSLSCLTIITINAIVSFQTRHKIIDCTDPGGDCAQDAQKQQAEIIKQLINSGHVGDLATQQIVRDSAVCSSKPENAGSAVKINACINAMLQAQQEKR